MISQTNALMSSALSVREDIDKFGYDSRVSNFQLLLKEVARNAKRALTGLEPRRRIISKRHSALMSQGLSSRCK